jgi:hypothetical protein
MLRSMSACSRLSGFRIIAIGLYWARKREAETVPDDLIKE